MYNQLTQLDVSNNPKLSKLHLTDNQLTAIDVSHNSKLRALWATGNPLTQLDISNNPSFNDYEVDEAVTVSE
ncbi:hypothetical protein ACVBIO_11130 [Shewanella sp. 0m-8]